MAEPQVEPRAEPQTQLQLKDLRRRKNTEKVRRYRARLRGENVPRGAPVAPLTKTGRPRQDLREAPEAGPPNRLGWPDERRHPAHQSQKADQKADGPGDQPGPQPHSPVSLNPLALALAKEES